MAYLMYLWYFFYFYMYPNRYLAILWPRILRNIPQLARKIVHPSFSKDMKGLIQIKRDKCIH